MSLNEILKDVSDGEEKKFKPLIGIVVILLILVLAMLMSLLSGPKKREFTGPPPIEEQISGVGTYSKEIDVTIDHKTFENSGVGVLFTKEELEKINLNAR